MVSIAALFPNDLERIGGLAYLTQLARSIPSVNAMEYYMQQLIEADARIRWNQTIEEYREKVLDPSAASFEELLDEFEQKALDIRPKKTRKNTAVDDLIGWYEDLVLKTQDPSRAFGLMTDYGELDRMTLGFQRADFFVVGARTSMGKSAFANEVALRVSKSGAKVAMFSLEMIKGQLYNRMISNLTGLSMQVIRVGNLTEGHLEMVARAMDRIRLIHIDDERGVTAEYITSEMRRLKRQEGLDIVIIDYLQEIKEQAERNDNSGSGLHRVCQKLRQAAKDCDCHVLGLSQVKREVEQRANKRPMTSDLSGSAAIEAVADGIILLYRDEYYNPETTDRGIIEVNLAKQRNGPTGIIKLDYNKHTQRITSRGG